jgi:hypothetical protein
LRSYLMKRSEPDAKAVAPIDILKRSSASRPAASGVMTIFMCAPTAPSSAAS